MTEKLTLFGNRTASQNLLAQHALTTPDNLVEFCGSRRTTISTILLANGISFAVQIAVFLVLGSCADFGSFRPYILVVVSLVAYGIGFGWLGVHTVDDWQQGLGLYITGLIAYQLALTFWTAAFPGLARNMRELRDKSEQLHRGEVTRDEYDKVDTMLRSRLSNVAFYVQSVGEIAILALIVGIIFALHVDESEANNNYGLSVVIAFSSGIWLLLSIPWFLIEKRRPGREPGMNIVKAGLLQLKLAMQKIWNLKQSLFYLIGGSILPQ